jgi:hypothetical protein
MEGENWNWIKPKKEGRRDEPVRMKGKERKKEFITDEASLSLDSTRLSSSSSSCLPVRGHTKQRQSSTLQLNVCALISPSSLSNLSSKSLISVSTQLQLRAI